tara:strand:+ start:1027 stop:1203 length:177 start_codon:yes stop_codon:yes gene_type:complete
MKYGSSLRGSIIFVTKANKEFGEYSDLENCLEKQWHGLFFMMIVKQKELKAFFSLAVE